MAESPANGKKSRFGRIPGISQATSIVSGTANIATGVVSTTAGAVGSVAGTALDVATLGKLERPPPPPDPLWDLHREPEPVLEPPAPKEELKARSLKDGAAGSWLENLKGKYEDEDLRESTTFIEYYLKDKLFGDWYHNAAVIFVSTFSAWLVARFRGSILWVVVICAFTSTYYRTSIRRTRRRVRDDLSRESALAKLETDAETMEWLNAFVVKFWAIYTPTLNTMVIETVNQVLSGTATPTPIDGLSLNRFTLGSKPPRIELVRSYPKTEDDIVVMDWGFSFVPNDIEDLSARQLKNKINPLIELYVRLGKGIVSTNMPVLVQDIAFKGMIQVKIKLITSFPHLQTVSISFLKEPYFDFVLKPVGGETLGFDINFIPGLEGFIKSRVHEALGPQFYAPNMFTLNIEQMLAGNPNDAAIGVLAVTLYSGNNLKGSDAIGNTVDPYVKLALGGGQEIARSSTKSDTNNPRWNETKFILVNSLTDALTMEIVDFNDVRKDRTIGTVTVPLEQLEENPEREGIVEPVLSNGKPKGQLLFDLRLFPVLTGKTLEDGTVEPPPQLNTGIVRFTVHQCKDLDRAAAKGFGSGGFNPFAIYYIDGKEVHTTKMFKRSNTPVWDEAHEALITNMNSAVLSVVVRDDKDLSGASDIATFKIPLAKLLAENEKGTDWFTMSPPAKVRMTAQWKPVAVKGVSGSGGYIPPIGIMRFHLQSASDLRNLEALGKVDPYVRAMVNNYQKNRTVTAFGTLTPVWDEIIYATVTSDRESIVLEVMDHENDGKDRSLGEVRLDPTEFIKKNELGEYVAQVDTTLRTSTLTMHGKSPKGSLVYTVSFYPLLNVMDPDDIAAEEKAKAEAEAAEAALTPEQRKKRDEEAAKKAAADKKKADEEAKKAAAASATTINGDKPDGAAAAVALDAETLEPAEPEKLRLQLPELVTYNTGLLIYKLVEGSFSKSNVYVQVYFDDFLYPSYVTGRLHNQKAKIEEVGDVMLRELDFSQMCIRVTTKENAIRTDNEGLIAENKSISTLAQLKAGYNKAVPISLLGKDGTSSVKIAFKYVPLQMQLDPLEGHINQGKLKIVIVGGTKLPAADRGNRSDPFCVLELNGTVKYKTEIKKKTLDPDWNESTEFDIVSRRSSKLFLKVYDWDMGPADNDYLGGAPIDLLDLDVMKQVDRHVTLDGKSGQIHLILFFKPGFVVRSTQGTASTTLAVPGMIVSAPLKGVGAVGGGVVSGVSKGTSFFRHGFRGKKESVSEDSASVMSGKASRKSLR
ncbi:C2 domain-containing protein [Lipomyces oligophaga]|uniref:C2 domain-containing protein n=1 Tax=Lipomyces oligophaga TaxID=45792 RepID=UPI0034CD31BD